MKSASESKSAARRLVACAAVALVAAAPAAWAQNSQRADHGTGAPILSPPDTSAQDGGSGMSNGNTAAPPPATRMNDARGKRSHARPHVRTKPGGPSAAGNGGSGGSAGMGGVGAGQAGTGAGAGAGRSSGATGSGGGGAGGTGSAGSSGY
ncbi:hypothetical protein [Burkholderia vietnamiensis]|uniref:hypothetical protein n=1 Tax=Burkholderia vietnamiensis TaxID=60552 RepID=UPI00075ED0EC|nr:hypothetical protein [Burkholderia vietnamiensis]KVR87600.1 hypothetical protein WK28_27095 [Burkholderia vietnamiensis]MBR8051302.1 hypothetical protein [Burkholderia vietnamiensis]MCA7944420.1 hypothetical protein [Burkholderia vietnamiensis]MDN8073100.1 hypothetical protein [Burkholderia vietnamiensis]HDR8971741.1 hypothetical protein [Burkholderia vietnamiensis]